MIALCDWLDLELKQVLIAAKGIARAAREKGSDAAQVNCRSSGVAQDRHRPAHVLTESSSDPPTP